MSPRRGFTIAETMVVAVILGMMLTAVTAAIAPLFDAPERAQAKSDTLAPAGTGMYLVERDLRESNINGVFACVGRPPACGDGSLQAADTAIVIPTALSSDRLGAQFYTASGSPDWQGFIVYWQRGDGGTIYRSFEPATGIGASLGARQPDREHLRVMAEDAANAAMAEPSPPIAMRNIAMLAALVDADAYTTSLHVVCAGYAGSHANTTTFDDDIFSRN